MIIGICGNIGSGKDTIADYLVLRYGFNKIFFSDALKQITSIITGWSYDYLNGSNEQFRKDRETIIHPIYKKTGRELLQYIGTDVFRDHFDKNIWVNIVKQYIEKNKYTKNIVISDCRFENEINMIKEFDIVNNVFFINVERNQNTITNHKTEGLKVNGNNVYNIDNSYSKDILYNNIDDLIKNILIYKKNI
jgi:hypothetical protein